MDREKVCIVAWTNKAKKMTRRLPISLRDKLSTWIEMVEFQGILTVRQISGLHDEPLQGKRFGQRSVRLNKGYRVIYIEDKYSNPTIIEIIEVTNHGY